ncbi:hypothetical protein H9P43_002690 [Blastocladiella emersonii ATCC 22665]|nr:hypothetical protein H9P43_002690 [Blastocladiella emersonii ATCC 22665]
MQSRSTLLLQRELYRLEQEPVWGTEIELVDSNVHHWRVTLDGLLETSWSGAQLVLDVQFPSSYDLDPPLVSFLTIPQHPNEKDGAVVCALLQYWVPGTTMGALFTTIQQLLSEPLLDDDCPANWAVARLVQRQPDEYRRRVAAMVKKSQALYDQRRWEETFSTLVATHLYTEPPPVYHRASPSPPPPQRESQQVETIPPREAPRKPRIRRLPFESYHASWSSLATTAPGNVTRIQIKEAGRPQSASAVDGCGESDARTRLVGIPRRRDIAAVIPLREGTMVATKPGTVAQRVAIENEIRHGTLHAPTGPLPKSESGRYWLIPGHSPVPCGTIPDSPKPSVASLASGSGVILEIQGTPPPPLLSVLPNALGLDAKLDPGRRTVCQQHHAHHRHGRRAPTRKIPAAMAAHDEWGAAAAVSETSSDTGTYTPSDRWTPSPPGSMRRRSPDTVHLALPPLEVHGHGSRSPSPVDGMRRRTRRSSRSRSRSSTRRPATFLGRIFPEQNPVDGSFHYSAAKHDGIEIELDHDEAILDWARNLTPEHVLVD